MAKKSYEESPEFDNALKIICEWSLERKQQLILDVLEYKSSPDSCNSVYIGGYARHQIMLKISKDYVGYPTAKTIWQAEEKKIDDAIMHARFFIQYMQDNPRKKCERCGNVIPDIGEAKKKGQ